MGEFQLFQGNCLEVMARLPGKSVDLIVTDPPYLMRYKSGFRSKDHKYAKEIPGDNDPELIRDYIRECYRLMKDDTAMYMFCNVNRLDYFKQELEKYFRVKNMIIWVKNGHTAGDLRAQFGKQYEVIFLVNKGRAFFNGIRLTDVWHFKRVGEGMRQHQKPEELIEQCITKHSNEGDTIFDGFMGSGTTGVAAAKHGRRFIGVEIEPDVFEVAKGRIEKL